MGQTDRNPGGRIVWFNWGHKKYKKHDLEVLPALVMYNGEALLVAFRLLGSFVTFIQKKRVKEHPF